MAEWHVPFHVIENEWTERQFRMMIARHNERRQREEREARVAARRSRGSRRGRELGEPVPYGEFD